MSSMPSSGRHSPGNDTGQPVRTLSPIGLGCYPLGGGHSPVTRAEARRTVDAALAHGWRVLDTAETYLDSEARLGGILGPRRDRVFLATKVLMIGIGGYYGSSEADLEKKLSFLKDEQGMLGMKFKIVAALPPRMPKGYARPARPPTTTSCSSSMPITDTRLTRHWHSGTLSPGDVPLRWFEKPTRGHAASRGLKAVRLRGNVNVAAGQSEISRVGMREMLVNDAIDVCNFDASWGGGLTEWRRVAALAATFDVKPGHHDEAQVASHLLASVPNGTYIESFSPTRDPIYWGLIANRPALVDGHLQPTDR